MTWSSRPLTSEERDRLAAELGPFPGERRGVVSKAAYYGSFLILIPIVVGGFLGRALMLSGLEPQTAYPVGFSIAALISPFIYFRRRNEERVRQARWTTRRAELESIQEVPTFHFRVEKAWAIESEPDWPAYLFRDPAGSYLLLSTPLLQFVAEPFAFDGLQITVASPDRSHILSVRWSGLPVALEARHLPTPSDWWPEESEFALVEAAKLPTEWQAVIKSV